MEACKFCYATNVAFIKGVCLSCQKTIDEARPKDELCDLCGSPTDEVGELIDDLCFRCNPESHEYETQLLEQQLWEG